MQQCALMKAGKGVVNFMLSNEKPKRGSPREIFFFAILIKHSVSTDGFYQCVTLFTQAVFTF